MLHYLLSSFIFLAHDENCKRSFHFSPLISGSNGGLAECVEALDQGAENAREIHENVEAKIPNPLGQLLPWLPRC